MRINTVRLQNVETIIKDKCDKNKALFARTIGMKSQAISKWWAEKDNRNISDASAIIIEKAFSLKEGWLDEVHFDQLNDEKTLYAVTNELHRIPVLGTAQMGDDGHWDFVSEHDAAGYVNLPSNDPKAYSLKLTGDSMRPAIKSGWYAICEPSNETVLGEFVHVTTTDGRSMVKELLINNSNQIVLDSVNENHKRITLEPEQIATMHHAFIVPPSKHSL